jgi:hypothetical protein
MTAEQMWDKWVWGNGVRVTKIMHDNFLTDIRSVIEGVLPEKKQIRYEELDTGVGIDKLEYDGQDREHGFNSCLTEIRRRMEEWK